MIFEIWVNFLVFFVAVTLSPGIRVERGLSGYIVSGALYTLLVFVLPKVIEFFKINVNFWSFFIIGSLFSIGYFYAMKYLVVGFLIFEIFPPTQGIFGLVALKGFELSESQVILFAGVFVMLLTSFNQWLMEK
jgi:hypothetical protein